MKELTTAATISDFAAQPEALAVETVKLDHDDREVGVPLVPQGKRMIHKINNTYSYTYGHGWSQ